MILGYSSVYNNKIHYFKTVKIKNHKNINKNREKVAKNDNNNIIDDTLKTLTETLAQQGELIEKLIDSQNEMIPRLGNNNNNKISINVFLNEHCKEAISLKDFINNIKISLDDLKYTNKHGYVKGISNIFTKHLTDLEATQRPIHCSDKKRLQFYVKEENKWEKDKNHQKIDKTIEDITVKQIRRIKEWEKQYPEWNKSDKETGMYLQMIKQVMGGNIDENTEEIKRNISEVIELKNTTIE